MPRDSDPATMLGLAMLLAVGVAAFVVLLIWSFL